MKGNSRKRSWQEKVVELFDLICILIGFAFLFIYPILLLNEKFPKYKSVIFPIIATIWMLFDKMFLSVNRKGEKDEVQ